MRHQQLDFRGCAVSQAQDGVAIVEAHFNKEQNSHSTFFNDEFAAVVADVVVVLLLLLLSLPTCMCGTALAGTQVS